MAQETRLWDSQAKKTRSMRSKEDAHDYRYFPDPDLPELVLEDDFIAGLRGALPELPKAKIERYREELGLSDYDAKILTDDAEIARFFEAALSAHSNPKGVANWVINELFGRLNKEGLGIAERPVSAAQLGGIIGLIKKGDISGKIAKDLFEIVYTEGGDPAEIVDARGMKQVTDTGAIEAAVDDIIAANPAQVEKAKDNPKLAGWFVGQVMKATGGKANPQAVQAIVRQKLGIE